MGLDHELWYTDLLWLTWIDINQLGVVLIDIVQGNQFPSKVLCLMVKLNGLIRLSLLNVDNNLCYVML